MQEQFGHHFLLKWWQRKASSLGWTAAHTGSLGLAPAILLGLAGSLVLRLGILASDTTITIAATAKLALQSSRQNT